MEEAKQIEVVSMLTFCFSQVKLEHGISLTFGAQLLESTDDQPS